MKYVLKPVEAIELTDSITDEEALKLLTEAGMSLKFDKTCYVNEAGSEYSFGNMLIKQGEGNFSIASKEEFFSHYEPVKIELPWEESSARPSVVPKKESTSAAYEKYAEMKKSTAQSKPAPKGNHGNTISITDPTEYLGFGKHKFETLENLIETDRSYIQWMLHQDFIEFSETCLECLSLEGFDCQCQN